MVCIQGAAVHFVSFFLSHTVLPIYILHRIPTFVSTLVHDCKALATHMPPCSQYTVYHAILIHERSRVPACQLPGQQLARGRVPSAASTSSGSPRGRASTAKGNLRLNLLSAAPPSAPVARSGIHLRVTAVLLAAKGKRPPSSAWALEAFDVDAHGAHHSLRVRFLATPELLLV